MKKIGTQPLETDRLLLRRFAVDDAEDIFRNWAGDPEVSRFRARDAESGHGLRRNGAAEVQSQLRVSGLQTVRVLREDCGNR